MKRKREYKTGNEAIDKIIKELVQKFSECKNEDLMNEMLTTVAKLAMEIEDRGDLKLINTALKELRYASKVFAPYRDVRKAVIFGSARVKEDSRVYQMAEELSRLLVENGFKIITGGGAGIMEAGNKGAGRENSFSVNIRLPFEQKHNPYIAGDKKSIMFKYFFNRKLFFLKESDATILFPGGFGTLDEGFENLTLIQTGKSKPRPIILIEPPDSQFWGHWIDLVMGVLAARGLISREDLSLFFHTHEVQDAVDKILHFYHNYHSIRYVGEKTIIRLKRHLSADSIRELNKRYKDILAKGEIEPSDPLPAERKKKEFLHLPRIVMKFNRKDFGKLHEMIRDINDFE